MERLEGIPRTAHRLAPRIPGEREPWAMPGSTRRFAAVESQRLETRIGAQRSARHLIDRNAIEEALPRCTVLVGARQPERAAVVTIAGQPVPEPLHDAEVGLVLGERLEQRRQRVASPRLADLRIPLIFRHAPAEAEEHEPLGRRRPGGGRRAPAEAERLERGQRDDRRAGGEHVTAGDTGGERLHGVDTPGMVTSCGTPCSERANE